MLRVAAIQHDIVWEDTTANFTAVAPLIEAAVGRGAGMVVLSEMWSTGFSMNAAAIAEPADGPTAAFMHETAARTGAWVVGSFPEDTEGYDRPTNRLLMAGPDGEDHRYSKIHPFTYSGEDEHYAAGQLARVNGRFDKCGNPLKAGSINFSEEGGRKGEQREVDESGHPPREAKNGTTAVVACRHVLDYTFSTHVLNDPY